MRPFLLFHRILCECVLSSTNTIPLVLSCFLLRSSVISSLQPSFSCFPTRYPPTQCLFQHAILLLLLLLRRYRIAIIPGSFLVILFITFSCWSWCWCFMFTIISFYGNTASGMSLECMLQQIAYQQKYTKSIAHVN